MAEAERPSWGKWGTWEETESLLDKEIGSSVGADEVERGSIRRWLEPIEFDCPLHYDDEVARKAGYEGIVAPVTMASTYGLPSYWKSGDHQAKQGDPPKQIPIPLLDVVPAPCTLSFASDIDIEFFAPLYVGDRITCTDKLIRILHKEVRVGKGAFLTQESTYRNQRGEVVAVLRVTIFRFNPPEKKEA